MSENCDCIICQRYRKYQEKIQKVSEEDKEFWQRIFENLYMVEEDNIYLEDIRIPKLEKKIKQQEATLKDIQYAIDLLRSKQGEVEE